MHAPGEPCEHTAKPAICRRLQDRIAFRAPMRLVKLATQPLGEYIGKQNRLSCAIVTHSNVSRTYLKIMFAQSQACHSGTNTQFSPEKYAHIILRDNPVTGRI
jgi:hypothetical protein